MEKEIKSIPFLLVEDNEDDIIIIKRVFKKVKLTNEVYVVRDGEEMFDFIYRRGKYAEKKLSLPGLILLDISMPGMNGFQVLNKLKEDLKTKKIPVVMLTTSDSEEDVVRSYENGACSYITKPVNFDDFVKAIERFKVYWTLVSKVPETV